MQNVVGVVEACADGRVWVEIGRNGCGRCAEPGGCGGVNIAQSCSAKKKFCLVDTLGLQPGEQVVIGIPDRVVVRTATTVYVVPLALGLLIAGVSHSIFDPTSALQDALGFLLGLAGGWWWATRAKFGPDSQPVLVAKAG
jgi:sigma-E factor negative regulatory protein RseC